MHFCDCPKSRFPFFAPHLAGRASEIGTATCQDRPVERLARSPLIPPKLLYYNFVLTILFLFVFWCRVQLGQNNHLFGCRNARGQTAVSQRFLPPQTLSSLSYVIWSAVCVLYVSWFRLFLLFCARFLTNFLLSLSFLATKARQNSATLSRLLAGPPLHNRRCPHHPPCVSPP